MNRITHTNSDEGFTLIELLVVILIIAILAAVGIVALLGAIRSGQDSAAKQTLANAYKEIISLEANGETLDFVGSQDQNEEVTTAKLNEISPDFKWQSTTIQGDPTNVVTVGHVSEGLTFFGVQSKSGKCLYVYSKTIGIEANDGIDSSHLNMISRDSYDTCTLIPALNNDASGPDLSLYKLY